MPLARPCPPPTTLPPPPHTQTCPPFGAVHGDGQAVRSYLYVEDVAAAFDVVLHKGQIGEVYNIGTQKERSVLSVASDICKHLGTVPDGMVKHVRDR